MCTSKCTYLSGIRPNWLQVIKQKLELNILNQSKAVPKKNMKSSAEKLFNCGQNRETGLFRICLHIPLNLSDELKNIFLYN